MAEKYYSISPYVYCASNPVNIVDPEGKDIYMLFYTVENKRGGDEMFFSAANTREVDIENSVFFDHNKDIVFMVPISDLSEIEEKVNTIVNLYSEKYGGTKEFSLWSHGGVDGPTGSIKTSQNALDENQMTIEGWGRINFNWTDNASANFYGCRTGVTRDAKSSFSTEISSLDNYKNVIVSGQPSYAYPSIYPDRIRISPGIAQNVFTYPVYMVAGNRRDPRRALGFTVNGKSMVKSRNGKVIY